MKSKLCTWIKCSDRLPDKNGLYFTFKKYSLDYAFRNFNERTRILVMEFNVYTKLWYFTSNINISIQKPDYWMKIPELPVDNSGV